VQHNLRNSAGLLTVVNLLKSCSHNLARHPQLAPALAEVKGIF
jgi:hypothetical protein